MPSQTQEAWSPPIGIAAHFARCGQQASADRSRVVWVGQRCFPFPTFLLATPSSSLLNRSYFVDARTPSDRLWVIEQAISSAVVGVAVADGSRFNMAATRRLQLLAKKHRAFVFLLRPFAETGELSAAQTRWLVRCQPPAPLEQPTYIKPRWELELWRCKGVRSWAENACWGLELDHVTRTLRVSAEMAHSANDAAMDENHCTIRRTA